MKDREKNSFFLKKEQGQKIKKKKTKNKVAKERKMKK